MSGSISLAKHNASLARVKARTASASDAVVEPLVHAAIGAGLAFLQGKLPPTLLDGMVPTDIVVSAGARLVALKTSGQTRKAAIMTSNAAAAVYGFEAFKKGTFIAGR